MTDVDTALLRRSRYMRRLIGCHLLLALVPVAIGFIPAEVRYLPLLWAVASIAVGQLMLLSFWAGLGKGSIGWRFIVIVAGITYLAIWSTLGSFLSGAAYQRIAKLSFGQYIAELGKTVSTYFIVAVLFAAAFLVVRRWWSELRLSGEADDSTVATPVQFSILNMLIVTTVIAILLSLARGARPASDSEWQRVAATTLAFVAFLIDALCAVWAALGIGRVRWRMVLVSIVAALLGLLMSITAGHITIAWWLVPGWMLASLVPIVIVIGSLLVLREGGYRLVPKNAIEG